jgi:hypothetical protein
MLSYLAARDALFNRWDAASSTAPPVVERLIDAPLPPGLTAFRVNNISTVALPTLADDAPMDVYKRYFARVVAVATGRCPLCDAVAGVSRDPDDGRAAFMLLPVQIEIAHLPGCPTRFDESDRCWFPAVAP